jgi:hypothetical protein
MFKGRSYLCFLQEFLLPRLDALPFSERCSMWLQHDGAPPHNALCARNFLDDKFPSRWIGRGGPIEWPPRSPDLSPLDFFSGVTLKGKYI